MSRQDMLRRLVSMIEDLPPVELGEVHHLIECLSSNNPDTRGEWRNALKPFLRKEEAAWSSVDPITMLETIRVGPAVEFTASRYFRGEGPLEADGVEYKYLGESFRELVACSTETNIPVSDLRLHWVLKKWVSDARPIVSALGSDEEVTVSPYQLHQVLKELGQHYRNPWEYQHCFGFCLAGASGQRSFVKCSYVWGWVVSAHPFTRFEDEVNCCRVIVTR